ncbi:hypothetical protein N39L_36370 [Limnospira platensis NIES-39]|uniref:Uncharacterized protein n=1 Tax=Limnospira platensis NIES-46 TaxID=1236695 RepID=A0A5M3TD44_LIMPL|nr:hypothetical protein N39L_36370 [Arthrospira platensis NIES-39]GCE95826.1 hypothetical protein NIES46_38920 [Arthrospira platensis NIES-46]
MLIKRKTILLTGLTGISLLYFITFSSFSFPVWMRGNLALIPLQVLAILYVIYWNNRH